MNKLQQEIAEQARRKLRKHESEDELNYDSDEIESSSNSHN